ncbi:hypothetical protein CRE_16394 [Caenorhabditis remanei]|uniref:Uncharacterized protein n=1 Tax=Caenorhabditis remanei TaxID=31234 RepID=E3NC67_CAERE|nr:hypothetical protein CRE_16394 [Caenorhabditis remanei]
MQNPSQYKIPNWFLNRQKGIEYGKTGQLLSTAVDNQLHTIGDFCRKADVDVNKRAGELSKEDFDKIVTICKIMQNPFQYKIPNWFLNRQKVIKNGKTGQVSTMMAMVNKVLDWIRSLFWKEEMELTLVGLQNSGKTTFVNVIASGQFTEDMIPTVGFNMRKITKGNVTIKLWDIGGQPRFRSMWERYCRGVNAIVFMVDAADEEKLEASRNELMQLLDKPQLDNIPVLVLGNKKNLPGALDERQSLSQKQRKIKHQNTLKNKSRNKCAAVCEKPCRRLQMDVMNRLITWSHPKKDVFTKLTQDHEFSNFFDEIVPEIRVYYDNVLIANNTKKEEESKMREMLLRDNRNEGSTVKSGFRYFCGSYEFYVEYSGVPKNTALIQALLDAHVANVFKWLFPRYKVKVFGKNGAHSMTFEVPYGRNQLSDILSCVEKVMESLQNGITINDAILSTQYFKVTKAGMETNDGVRFVFTKNSRSQKVSHLIMILTFSSLLQSFQNIIGLGNGLHRASVEKANLQ